MRVTKPPKESSNKWLWLLKPWVGLGLFLLLWWLVPTGIKTFLNVARFEFQAPVWKTVAHAADLSDYWSLKGHSKKELIERIRDLSRSNSAYARALQESKTLRHELGRLEELLELPKYAGFRSIPARILRRHMPSWTHECLIHKGSANGIKEGCGVISKYGVVGRVKAVFEHTAVVELASSPLFRIIGHFLGDPRPITYQGAVHKPFNHLAGAAYNVPYDIHLDKENPLALVSSRVGGTFPEGLLIGYLEMLEPGTEGLFQAGRIELDKSLSSLNEVVVLVPL